MSHRMRAGTISQSLRAFLEGIVDYAGLFPPANLDFDSAISNYASYRSSDDRWMLGAFVCPAARVPDLLTNVDILRAKSPHPITLLGSVSHTLDEWESGLHSVRRAVDLIADDPKRLARTASLELKLPLSAASSPAETTRALDALYDVFADEQCAFDFFVEVVPAAGPDVVSSLARALKRRDANDGRSRGALKIRTGGVTPESVPSVLSVAKFLCACRDAEIRFKATAGLHHPMHHFSKEVGAPMHGFLGVFCGAMTAAEHGLNPTDLGKLLLSEDADTFAFGPDGMTTGGMFVSIDRIVELRSSLAVSFGSCSFDEPRHDLQELGLLPSSGTPSVNRNLPL